jgi:biotin operon repressor
VEEMRQVAQMLGLQQDKLMDLIESLNNQGYLIKKANKLYQLMSLDI